MIFLASSETYSIILCTLSHSNRDNNKIKIKTETIKQDQDIIVLKKLNKKSKNLNNNLSIIKIQETIGKIKEINVSKKEIMKEL